MVRTPKTTDIRGRMVLLGTGTSVGVPTVGCDCAVCASDHPRNQRTRCAVVFGLPEGNLLIDTPPDLRMQLLREGIGIVHAVAFTHEHADHIFGLDDLRIFQFYLGHSVPLYCEAFVEDRLRHSFDYAFAKTDHTHVGAVPALRFHRIQDESFEVLGAQVQPIRLQHGPRFQTLDSAWEGLHIARTRTRSLRRVGRCWKDWTHSCSTPCGTSHTRPISACKAR